MSDFRLDATNLQSSLRIFEERALQAMSVYAETAASDLEGYMKQNRPWTDRTGQARQRLKGTAERVSSNNFLIALSQGVDYGIWLELAHEKRYAILEPTVRLRGPEVVRGFRGLLGSLEGSLGHSVEEVLRSNGR